MPSFLQLALASQSLACLLPAVRASAVADLNRVTFTGNVLANKQGEGPEGWVVLFCAEWFEPCQVFQEGFLSAATEYGSITDDKLFSRTTRFAQVDCAVDKVLCNSQDVDAYPTVLHYRHGGRVGEWSQSGRSAAKEAASFVKWAKKQLEQLEPTGQVTGGTSVAVEADAPAQPAFQKVGVGMPVEQALPLLVMLAAGAMWVNKLVTELRRTLQVWSELAVPSVRQRLLKARPATTEQVAEWAMPVVVLCLPEAWGRTSVVL